VLAVLRAGSMSDWDITTSSRRVRRLPGNAFRACLLQRHRGHPSPPCSAVTWDAATKIIAPSMTYWASALPAFSLGQPSSSLTSSPTRSALTRATSSAASPRAPRPSSWFTTADTPPTWTRSWRSPASTGEGDRGCLPRHGSLYRRRLTGAIGDVAAMSLMSGKSLPPARPAFSAPMIARSTSGRWPSATTSEPSKT